MKLYLIAGEASGDLHGSNLMKAISAEQPDVDFRCWGGDLMEAAGGTIVKHYRELAFMGFVEVIANLRTILRNIDQCKSDILACKPDALVLIDYPGFNLRIAEWANKQGIRVFYYISPQIWAWKQGRVHKITRDSEQVYCILPFEKDFYAKFGYEVEFVGHPLLDAIAGLNEEKPAFEQFCRENGLDKRPIVALLPGSRAMEIGKMLTTMLQMVERFPDYQFVIAGAPSQPAENYREFVGNKPVHVLHDKTYALLQQATAALVTSGTATLETGLFGVPQVVCYKGNPISYQIARRLVKVDYISLVNLIMEGEVVRELIQHEFNNNSLEAELKLILPGGEKRAPMLANYEQLRHTLGGSGASRTTAQHLLKTLSAPARHG